MEDHNEDLEKNNFNVYVGASTGVLKGIYFGTNTPILKNFSPETFKGLQERPPITSLSWSSAKNKSLLVSYEDGSLATYNPKIRTFTKVQHVDVKSPLVSAFELESQYVTALENGRVGLFNPEKDETTLEINTGSHLSVVKQFEVNSSVFATGGKESDLKIWDLNSENKPAEPIFKARNVPHDFLDLRVPVWVQDLAFVNKNKDLVAICSRFGHARIYDVRGGNRPQVDFKPLDDEGLMAICDTGQSWQVVVGGNKGTTASVDLRYPGKGRLVHKFSSASGSVRSLDFMNNYVVSCGLDRHLYVYNLYEKKALKKLYLKTRLTSVLMTEDFRFGKKKELEEEEEEEKEVRRSKRFKSE